MTNTTTTQPRTESITEWVNAYLLAWTTNDRKDIAALFTEDAEYHESPYDTEWVGRDEIVDGWRSRWDWQQGGWTFEWSIASVEASTVVITGIGHYTELGDFDNVWTVTFDETGRCSRFVMLNTERV
ncbi:ketosteroid isomerase-like protein [Conyzicola lurida]|uniref:Ketosteroid isomerase-like protein n=1 Tax=Conyzicola lurida TaxID=1172621 RepID=A0A841AI92_9MICO|nr:nuclear transport factor 2 family protein [Conyzicola lurida]MBB5841712.1 ketosteroid isomerase-like protein [Conyzicola lurida]